jgi:hypothetical protein
LPETSGMTDPVAQAPVEKDLRAGRGKGGRHPVSPAAQETKMFQHF